VVAYETFIGGTGSDTSVGIGVDGGGNAYLVGNTSSANFPTSGIPYQTAPETKGTQCASITCTSVFVSVLNSSGSALTYSSYLSGNGNDQASGMTIDANGDVFLTGTTTSNDAPAVSPVPVDFPATELPVPFQVAPNASIQFFVTKVNTKAPGVASIAYSTYFGGGLVSSGTVAVGGGIAVDSTGNMYFSGTTNFFNSGQGEFGDSSQSTDFPILNAYQPCLDTPPPDHPRQSKPMFEYATPYAVSYGCFRCQAEPQCTSRHPVAFLDVPWGEPKRIRARQLRLIPAPLTFISPAPQIRAISSFPRE